VYEEPQLDDGVTAPSDAALVTAKIAANKMTRNKYSEMDNSGNVSKVVGVQGMILGRSLPMGVAQTNVGLPSRDCLLPFNEAMERASEQFASKSGATTAKGAKKTPGDAFWTTS
jgi:hypothetical protein